MKICMFIPSLNGGGAERVFVNLANYFFKNGLEVILVSSSLGVYGKDLEYGVKFISIKEKKGKIKVLRRITNIIHSIYHLNLIVKKERPNILFSTLALGNIISFFVKFFFIYNLKLVTRQANVLNTASKNKVLNFLLKKSFIASDLIIANSYDTSDSVYSLCKKKSISEKTIVIGNPVYSEGIIVKGDELVDFSYLKFGKYILNIGRFTKEKDHFTLLKAYKDLLNFYKIDLVLLGVGPLKIEIENLIDDLGINDSVHVVGFQSNPYPFYKNAEIFALTSTTEGFGNVLVEALAFGLQIVSTNCVGGPSYILNNGEYGKLVEIESPKAFSDSLLLCLKQVPDQYKLIKRAKEFSEDNIGSLYLKAFAKILK